MKNSMKKVKEPIVPRRATVMQAIEACQRSFWELYSDMDRRAAHRPYEMVKYNKDKILPQLRRFLEDLQKEDK